MSTQVEADVDIMRCASCGITEADDIKLKKCDDCDLVRYCSVECQQDHLPQHEEACMERHDEILFKQPESTHEGDCPICCLPLPLEKSTLMACCSKKICKGCSYASAIREIEQNLERICPFCRHPAGVESDKIKMKRVKANEPVAMREVGKRLSREGDYESAIDYWEKSA